MTSRGPGDPVLRIAHAFGNSRPALARALEASVDMIETDIGYRAREIWVRHERRLSWLPLLIDKKSRLRHGVDGLVIRLPGRYYLRPDVNSLKLDEVLTMTGGRRGLLLDVKARKGDEVDAFASALAGVIDSHGAAQWIEICGQYWPVLDRLDEIAPHLRVRYSVERAHQWQRLVRMVQERAVRSVCIEHRFMTGERARFLERHGIDVYCWTVDERAEAKDLIARGVDGIISNDLALLESLRATTAA